MIAAGISAGVSTAFGAPVGGALFAFEMSNPNTFWDFAVLWKCFFSCSIAVLSVSICRHLMVDGNIVNINSVADLKFTTNFVKSADLSQFPAAIIIGIICGCLGSLFIYINSYINIKRKKIITKNWQKVLEVVIFSLVTSTVFFWMPLYFNECKSNDQVAAKN